MHRAFLGLVRSNRLCIGSLVFEAAFVYAVEAMDTFNLSAEND